VTEAFDARQYPVRIGARVLHAEQQPSYACLHVFLQGRDTLFDLTDNETARGQ